MINDYLTLAKWRLGLGNLLAAAAGFALGAALPFNWPLFAATLIGLYFIIGSAAAFNNYFDMDIDARMARTRDRALPAGRLSPSQALVFGFALLIAGTALLWWYTNALALGTALTGFVFYVCLYTPLKRATPHTLWVGAVSGAMPPVVGYAAAAGTIDMYALALFAALYLWQLPHAFAISVYRFKEYENAGIPLFLHRAPSERSVQIAQKTFRYSLAILLVGCIAIPVLRFAL